VVDCIQDVDCSPDLILITVKSYDTDTALNDARPLLTPKTLVLSLQNGLDNLEKMEKIVEKQNIFGGVTTHGAFFVKPGIVEHTGLGRTVIGPWKRKKTLFYKSFIFSLALRRQIRVHG